MKEFLDCIWNLIKEPYILFGLISTLIIFSLDDIKIIVRDNNDKK